MNKPIIISSQEYRNEEIVNEKRASKDYKIFLTPEFIVNGITYQAIIDGHHSHEAALIDGEDVEIEITHEYDFQLERNPLDFLEESMIDTMWYNLETDNPIDFSDW